jgi:hypothetical protein
MDIAAFFLSRLQFAFTAHDLLRGDVLARRVSDRLNRADDAIRQTHLFLKEDVS